MAEIKIPRPENIPDHAWELEGVSADGTRRTFVHWIDRERGILVKKTENLYDEELFRMNKHQFDESHGKRFGDGQVVARIPLNVFYRDFPKYKQEGDTDFTKWWLNRDENKPFRTFRGKF